MGFTLQNVCKHPIAAVIIAKNESKWIGDCVATAAMCCDQIIIVDTGSTDNTLVTAKNALGKNSFRCRFNMFHFDWCDDYSAARNYGLSCVEDDYHWILHIDCDERLTESAVNFINELRVKDVEADAFETPIYNLMGNGQSMADGYVSSNIRVFRNKPDIRYKYRIHETVTDNVVLGGYKIEGAPRCQLVHFGYTTDVMKDRKKASRYIDLLKAEYEENGAGSAGHIVSHLAWAYCVAGKYEESIAIMDAALEASPPGSINRLRNWVHLVQAWMSLKDYDKAMSCARQAESEGIKSPELDYCLASLYSIKEDKEKAIEYYRSAMGYADKGGHIGDAGTWTWKSWLGMAQCLASMSKWRQAFYWARRHYRAQPNSMIGKMVLHHVCVQLGIYKTAAKLQDELVKQGTIEVVSGSRCAKAGLLNAAGDLPGAASEAIEVLSAFDASYEKAWKLLTHMCRRSGLADLATLCEVRRVRWCGRDVTEVGN